jgi:hypothetical protein
VKLTSKVVAWLVAWLGPPVQAQPPRISQHGLHRILFRNHVRESAITEFLCSIDKLWAVTLLYRLLVVYCEAMARMRSL